jgi:hypothetical protein
VKGYADMPMLVAALGGCDRQTSPFKKIQMLG